MNAVRVVPATADTWPGLGRAFGPRAKDPTSCWCQRFRRHQELDNRSALHREVETARLPVGLLAIGGDEDVVGWTRVVPRSTLPGVTENRALARILDADANAWWVSCFAVRREHRGSGVGTALLKAAVDWAAQHDASVLDGHPVDTDGLASTPAASALFTGTLAMFGEPGSTRSDARFRLDP